MTEATSPINVMVVDDHDQIRRGLSIFLRAYNDFTLIAEATNGLEALSLCDILKPDVILMDIVMPDMNGYEATQAILHQYSNIRIIALTSYDDDELIQKIMDAGAIGYLPKDISAGELAEAIRLAVR